MNYISKVKMTDAMYREFTSKVLCRNTTVTLELLELAGIAGFITASRAKMSGLSLVMGIVVLVLLAVMLIYPVMTQKKLLRAQKELHHGESPETSVSFTDTNIRVAEGKMHMTVPYDQVTSVIRMKSCSALMLGKSHFVFFNEATLNVNAEKFYQVLQQKCPKVYGVNDYRKRFTRSV